MNDQPEYWELLASDLLWLAVRTSRRRTLQKINDKNKTRSFLKRKITHLETLLPLESAEIIENYCSTVKYGAPLESSRTRQGTASMLYAIISGAQVYASKEFILATGTPSSSIYNRRKLQRSELKGSKSRLIVKSTRNWRRRRRRSGVWLITFAKWVSRDLQRPQFGDKKATILGDLFWSLLAKVAVLS